MSLDLSQGLDTGAERAPAPVAVVDAGPDRRRATALHAVRRDLDRVGGVLAGPITPVRRAALVAHLAFLVEQVRRVDPDLANRHSVTLSRLRHESRLWSREPSRRDELRAAAEFAATALAAGVRADDVRADDVRADDLARAATGEVSPRPANPAPVRLRDLPGRRPTSLAFRYFWLLDGLPPHLSAGVTDGFTGPARWVLRNVLSGGYNRRAYLMWVGGGSGRAV